MKNSRADVVACVSVVRSERPWLFCAVGGQRIAPRWVLLDGLDSAPRCDLGSVAEHLAERLGPQTQDRPLDGEADRIIQSLIERLRQHERALLPIRRQRALHLVEEVLKRWIKQAREKGAQERRSCLLDIKRMFDSPSEERPWPDPRALAEAWLKLIRPVQRRALELRRKRARLWRFEHLKQRLLEEPLSSEAVRAAFAEIPPLAPLSERVVAIIVVVPDAAGESAPSSVNAWRTVVAPFGA